MAILPVPRHLVAFWNPYDLRSENLPLVFGLEIWVSTMKDVLLRIK